MAQLKDTIVSGSLRVTDTTFTNDIIIGASQAAHTFLASPSTAAGAPAWRTLAASDIPDISGTYATNTYVNTTLSNVANALVFKGTLGTNGTITAVPDGTSGKTYKTGYTYRIITPGTYAGFVCETGDLLIAISNSTSGQTAVNNAHWTSVETNENGAVIGPVNSTTGHIVTFDGNAGRVIQDSGKIFSTTAPGSSSTDTQIPTSKAVWSAITGASGYGKTGTVTSITIKTSSPLTGGSNTATTTTGTYTLGIDTSGDWSGTAAKATKANIISNIYGVSYYSDTVGTFKSTGTGAAGNVFIGSGNNAAPTWYAGLSLTGAGTQQSPYNANFSNTVTITGASTLSSTLSVASTSTLTGNVTIGDNSHASTLTVFGATTLKNTASIIGNTTIGNSSTASTLEVYGATTLNSTSKLTGKVGIGTDPDSATTGDIHILTIKGNTRILNSSSTVVAHIDTNTTSGSLITIHPHTTNTGSLGTSTYRWAALYIGTANSYGDVYTPIYWNNGVPATVTPTQRLDFEFNTTNTSSISFTSSAITLNTEVSQIVVTSGISYLNSEITWTVAANSNSVPTLILSATTNIPSNPANQKIEGYIILAHTANITSNT